MEDWDAYFRIVGERALLTREEEVSLSNRIRNRDENAREVMICANLRMVAKIARDYVNLGLPLLDLIQEGNIGLMKAVDKFDPSHGCKFSTYAYYWIHQAVLRALCNQGRLIRLPVSVVGELSKLRRNGISLASEFKQYQKEKPETEDHGFSEKQMVRLGAASQSEQLVWLNAPVGDGDAVVADFIPAEMDDGAATEMTERLGLNGKLAKMIGGLSRNERIVLGMRFGLNGATPKTLEDIAPILGVTRERVRQIERKSLKKLRVRIELSTAPSQDNALNRTPPHLHHEK